MLSCGKIHLQGSMGDRPDRYLVNSATLKSSGPKHLLSGGPEVRPSALSQLTVYYYLFPL